MPKYVVRYGVMRALGVLSTRGNDTMTRGTKVIARTSRGLEAGEVLCEATQEVVSQLKDPAHGQILRRMTSEDANELAHMKAHESKEFKTCQEFVEKLNLDMQLVRYLLYATPLRQIVGRRCGQFDDHGHVVRDHLAKARQVRLKTA